MPQETTLIELSCTRCGCVLSAKPEQLGRTVACPQCRHQFVLESPARSRVDPSDVRPFHFQCLRCGSVLEARANQACQRGKCPTCDAVFQVPEMDPRTGLARANADPGADGENPTPVHAYAAAGNMAPKIIRESDDSLLIECPRCGEREDISANNCSACGLPFTIEGVSAVAVTTGSSEGKTALLLAVLGLPLSLCGGVGIALGIAAIILGFKSMAGAADRDSWRAAVAIGLGLLDCLVSVGVWVSIA